MVTKGQSLYIIPTAFYVTVKKVGETSGTKVGWPKEMDTPEKITDKKLQAWITNVFKEHKSTIGNPTSIHTDEGLTKRLEVNSHVVDGTILYIQPIDHAVSVLNPITVKVMGSNREVVVEMWTGQFEEDG